MDIIVVALILVALTTADGAKVFVNPAFVAKVYPTKEAVGQANTLVVKGAKCVVVTSDGKFMSVLEDCELVRRKLEGRR